MIKAFWAIALFGVLAVPALCDTLYSTGPIWTGVDGSGYGIDAGQEVTDSFVLSADSVLTGVSNIGLSVRGEDTPETLDWIISSAPDGDGTVAGFGSGVALSDSFFEQLVFDPTVDGYYASFTINNLALSAGTYYLELTNATTQNSEPVNSVASEPFTSLGPTIADYEVDGSGPFGPIASEAFEIDGYTAAPEPSGVVLSILALGVLGVAALRNRSVRSMSTHTR